MRKWIALLLTAVIALGLCACGGTGIITSSDGPKEVVTTGSGKDDADGADGSGEAETDTRSSTEQAAPQVEIVVKDYGTIRLELDPSAAPITVANFIDLAGSGFYDGLTFHRIMEGFMIQGGDPEGTGNGGSGATIKGEFAENGVLNPISHVRGVISMARATPPDSASSQFFIVQQDSTFLDRKYAAFGHVTEGMEVVDAICADAVPIDDNGTIPPDRQPVIERVTVLN